VQRETAQNQAVLPTCEASRGDVLKGEVFCVPAGARVIGGCRVEIDSVDVLGANVG